MACSISTASVAVLNGLEREVVTATLLEYFGQPFAGNFRVVLLDLVQRYVKRVVVVVVVLS